MPGQCDVSSCMAYNIPTTASPLGPLSLRVKISLGEKTPPKRDEPFQVEVIQGRIKEEPQTLRTVREIMLCVVFRLCLSGLINALTDIRRVSQSAQCLTGEMSNVYSGRENNARLITSFIVEVRRFSFL